MEWTRLTFLAAILLIAPACGDDDNGDDDDDVSDGSVDDGGGGTDGPANLIDAYQDDAGLFICPDGSGQMLPCQCNDGMDNDGDGDTDTNDANCASPDDNTEFPTAVGTTGCTNGVDDDGDGAIDSADPECTGPLDEDEETFATGIPGDNMDECHQDCWFDGDSGQGNDGCNWLLGCDPLAGPIYGCSMPNPNQCDDPQSQKCMDFCQQYTPNGCDCFGCCDIFVGGTTYTVLLHEMCTTDVITDTSKCVPCTKVADCDNPCGLCEFCIGREPDPGCSSGTFDAPPDEGCEAGQTPCDPTDPDNTGCAVDEFCLTGCCVSTID